MDFDIDAIFDAVERETETETENRPNVQRAFRGKNIGGNDPQSVSIDRIFEAVRDYELSRRWN